MKIEIPATLIVNIDRLQDTDAPDVGSKLEMQHQVVRAIRKATGGVWLSGKELAEDADFPYNVEVKVEIDT